MNKFTAIVLAAGKGERMRSSLPKVLHDLMGRPLIYYVLRELLSLKQFLRQIIVVVGHNGKVVKTQLKKYFSTKDLNLPKRIKLEFVYQSESLGTAKAVEVALKKVKYKQVIVICADTPLITAKTLGGFISYYLHRELTSAILTTFTNKENALGVILRDGKGNIKAIREKLKSKDAAAGFLPTRTESQEVNSGIYCFTRKILLENLPKIRKNKTKREYFLTDIIGILYAQGEMLDSYTLYNSEEILGINTQADLVAARSHMQRRILDSFVEKGVRVIDYATTFIEEGVKIGKNTVIYPFTFIEKDVIIGSNCLLGPFVHIRKGTSIKDNTQVGNFLEINRTKIGRKVKVKHFGYLGDAVVGDNANVGAGTVTANFDGKTKWRTYIQKNAFIGSDTVLVAPVRVGKSAVTGAGSVITKDVKPKTVVIGVPAKVFKKKKR